jgi:hypothetical protein
VTERSGIPVSVNVIPQAEAETSCHGSKFAFFHSLLTALIACSVAEAGNVRRYYAEAPLKDCRRLKGR